MKSSSISTLCDFTSGTRSYVANKQDKINLQETYEMNGLDNRSITLDASLAGRPIRIVNNTNQEVIVTTLTTGTFTASFLAHALPGDSAGGALPEVGEPSIRLDINATDSTIVGSVRVIVL